MRLIQLGFSLYFILAGGTAAAEGGIPILSILDQARLIEMLGGVTVAGSLTAAIQRAEGASESPANYRGDFSVTLPGGNMGDIEGKIFGHLRFGQGKGVALRPTHTATANSTTCVAENGGASAILAQAWYQLKVFLPRGGAREGSREHLHLTAGKIDPFVFFDQNAIADDESSRFMNNAFVHNPLLDSGGDIASDTHGFARGAIVQYVNERQKGNEWMLSLGAFGSGAFVIAQAETAARFNHLPGNYRIYAWKNGRAEGYDGAERRHGGIGFSGDQKITRHLALFARFGHQASGKVRFDRALTVGAELAGNDWGRAADAFGVAIGGLKTSQGYQNASLALAGYRATGWEQQMEFYYRYRLNSHVELTPDFQLIRNPGGDGSASTVKVVGLRAKFRF